VPDWLQVFDDQGPAADQDRVRDWLQDKTISSSQEALEHFLDDHFVIDGIVFRSQFRIDRDLEAEPSDLVTVHWGLEHIERLRRGRTETRQSIVALTTGIGGVAIGAMVALTAPMGWSPRCTRGAPPTRHVRPSIIRRSSTSTVSW
jgi:hypothetical protein